MSGGTPLCSFSVEVGVYLFSFYVWCQSDAVVWYFETTGTLKLADDKIYEKSAGVDGQVITFIGRRLNPSVNGMLNVYPRASATGHMAGANVAMIKLA